MAFARDRPNRLRAPRRASQLRHDRPGWKSFPQAGSIAVHRGTGQPLSTPRVLVCGRASMLHSIMVTALHSVSPVWSNHGQNISQPPLSLRFPICPPRWPSVQVAV